MLLAGRLRLVNRHAVGLCRRHLNEVYLLNKRKPLAYGLEEAINALRCYSFQEDETVNATLLCNLRTKEKDKLRNPFRGRISYPCQFGNRPTILLICEDEAIQDAEAASVDIVGGVELVNKIIEKKVDFDICMCTTGIYPQVQTFKELKQHMPHPRRGTVIDGGDISEAVETFTNTREYKCDNNGECVMPIGELNFPLDHLLANFKTLVEEVFKHREKAEVNKFIIKIYFSTTFGPSFLIDRKEMFALQPTIETNKWKLSSL